MKKKLITGLGLAALGIVLLSFINGEEPKMKRYEVIRSVNGEVSTYDTLVAESSTFTPEHYLEQLGFASDEHIEIINLAAIQPQFIMQNYPGSIPGTDSMIIMEFHGDVNLDSLSSTEFQTIHQMKMDSAVVFEMEFSNDQFEWSGEGEQGEMMIQKNVMIKQIDSLNFEITELERLMEILVIDGMTEPAAVTHKVDSNVMIMQTIVLDQNGMQKMTLHPGCNVIQDGPVFEHHAENQTQLGDIKVFSQGEDFTLVIVSDGAEPKSKSSLKTQSPEASEVLFKIYPNPANKEVSVQFNFEEKAATTITVSDAYGKVVMQWDLGNFSGSHTQTIDVSKWSKGIYFVNVDRAGLKLVEKLVVE